MKRMRVGLIVTAAVRREGWKRSGHHAVSTPTCVHSTTQHQQRDAERETEREGGGGRGLCMQVQRMEEMAEEVKWWETGWVTVVEGVTRVTHWGVWLVWFRSQLCIRPRWMSHCFIACSSFYTQNTVDSISMESRSSVFPNAFCLCMPERSTTNEWGKKRPETSNWLHGHLPATHRWSSSKWQIVYLMHNKKAVRQSHSSGAEIIVIHLIQRVDVSLWLVMRSQAQCHDSVTHTGRNKQWGTEHNLFSLELCTQPENSRL